MSNISFDRKFENGFMTIVTGNGKTSVEGHTLNCVGSGSDRAVRHLYVPVKEGAIINVSVTTRVKSGESRLAVDYDGYNKVSGQLNHVRTVSKEWDRVTVKTHIPYGSGIQNAVIVLGKWGSQTEYTDVDYRDLEVEIINSYGQPNLLAKGLILGDKGSFSVRQSYANTGIEKIEYDATRKEAKVFMYNRVMNGTQYSSFPIIKVSGTTDNVLVPLSGGYNGSDNTFTIKWTNGTEFVDISSKTLYVFVTVEI